MVTSHLTKFPPTQPCISWSLWTELCEWRRKLRVETAMRDWRRDQVKMLQWGLRWASWYKSRLLTYIDQARVTSADGRGKKFFDKPSFEIRFGKPNAIRFVRGLETTLTGACVDEKRSLYLGPNLAYGEAGKKDGSVQPGDSVRSASFSSSSCSLLTTSQC